MIDVDKTLTLPGHDYSLHPIKELELDLFTATIPLGGFNQMFTTEIVDIQEAHDILSQTWAQHWVLLDAHNRPCGLIRMLPELSGGVSLHGMGWTPDGSTPFKAQRAYSLCWIYFHAHLLKAHNVLYSSTNRSNTRALKALSSTGYQPIRTSQLTSGTQIHLELNRSRFESIWGKLELELSDSPKISWTIAASHPEHFVNTSAHAVPVPWSPEAKKKLKESTEAHWSMLLPSPQRVKIIAHNQCIGELTMAKPRKDLFHAIWHPMTDWTNAQFLARIIHTLLTSGSTLALDSDCQNWQIMMNSMARFMGHGPQGQKLWQI